jgi:hypothetical protein
MFTGKGFEELNKENIFKKISEYDVFKYYIPDFNTIGQKFSSPFRNDSNPSCIIREYNGNLFYKDFGTGESYGAIAFVMAKYSMSFGEALIIISSDFNLGLHSKAISAKSMGFVAKKNVEVKSIPSKPAIIRIKRRKWNDGIDKEYWGKYGFKRAVLSFFNIFPISHLWVNGKYIVIKEKEPSYAYVLEEGEYKILSPYSMFKWITNGKGSIQGLKQIPSEGDLLIITSSLKDAMLLWILGCPAIAPASENTAINIEQVEELKKRFTNIVVFFDNDEAGIRAAEAYKETYGLPYVHLPEGPSKDISDYYVANGREKTHEMMNNLIKEW